MDNVFDFLNNELFAGMSRPAHQASPKESRQASPEESKTKVTVQELIERKQSTVRMNGRLYRVVVTELESTR